VESSTFGSEFVALRTAVELIIGLQYKLRMFGVPLAGPANVFCDNQSVVHNASTPESTLAKKHNAICYHCVREAAAASIVRAAKEDSKTNLADGLTKPLPRDRRSLTFGNILYGLYSNKEMREDYVKAQQEHLLFANHFYFHENWFEGTVKFPV
jgi:hypothetical protein